MLSCALNFALAFSLVGCSHVPGPKPLGKTTNPNRSLCDEAARAARARNPTSFQQIACLHIPNDTEFPRREVAYSSIPLRRGRLRTLKNLSIIGSKGETIPAQFKVIARWNGVVDDPNRSIQWLQVTVPASIEPRGSLSYLLARHTRAKPAPSPIVRVEGNRSAFIVHTGVARFTLLPTLPGLLSVIEVTVGKQTRTIFKHRPGAGPRLVLSNRTILDTRTPDTIQIDPNGFRIIEAGPVRAVVQQKGHFVGKGETTLCPGHRYPRFGFTVEMSFTRMSADVGLRFHFRNECGSALRAPWTDEHQTVSEVAFRIPMNVGKTPVAWSGGSGPIKPNRVSRAGTVRVEQRKGQGTPWKRSAAITVNQKIQEEAEFFENPVVAVLGQNLTVSAQMPWMRYREPQAIQLTDGALEFVFVSEPLVIGEAKGIWNLGRLNIRPNMNAAAFETLRDMTQVSLERGLLPTRPLPALNQTKVLPNLGTRAPSLLKTQYRNALHTLHEDTVRPRGQWARAKTFGSQLWPETIFDRYAVDNANPYEHGARMNYWNPTGLELLEFFRSGEPKWAWDMALPGSWLQMFTAYYNIGDHTHGSTNGFAVSSGGQGEGQWHRSGQGSSDYSYNQGMFLAYLLRPSATLLDRFRQAGITVLNRYNVPRNKEAIRENAYTQIRPTRQVLQHLEMLMNCARFVPKETGAQCQNKLKTFLTELLEDNLQAGFMCTQDIPSKKHCHGPQQFMINSMHYAFFHRYYRDFEDPTGRLKRALARIVKTYYVYGLKKQRDGRSIDLASPFASRLDCTLKNGGKDVAHCSMGKDSDNRTALWNQNKPHTLSLLFLGHELAPKMALCKLTKKAFDDQGLYKNWSGGLKQKVGYWKGANQMLQGIVFAVGGYDHCEDP